MFKAFQALSHVNSKTTVSVALCAAFLTGCGATGDIAENVISGGAEPVQVSRETFAPPVPCPPLQMKTNSHLIREFVRGKDGERDGLIYQALVEDSAVSCSQEADGQRRLKLGFTGDVTPGPAWRGGDVVLPLRVTIPASSDAEQKPLVSEVIQIPVSIEAGGRGQQWTYVDEKFVIPMNQGSKIQFGFEEGRRR
ncbi:hypothetical protein [Roseibium alexandrii]|uniref:Lipoprotein n=1 Tax=Roseibium alexandrii TaxID=388408 RepID=A0A0M7A5G2_9HYPH|nr:hypothetical protein [Roseibium alexandrii]CTQ70139.1 hypothetical protein LAX5112_02376 [Roseibium alexandrii]